MNNLDNVQLVKLEVVAEAVRQGNLDKLQSSGFFKKVDQIIRSGKVRTHNRIWLGRQLKSVFDGSAPNPGGVAIFQKPNEFKDIRKWERENT